MSGIKLYMQPEQDLTLDTTVSPNQYSFVLRATSRPSRSAMPELIARLQKIPSLADVQSDMNTDGMSVNVEVNRQLAARFGITPATVDNALYDALGQRIVSTIFQQSDQYRVILVAKPEAVPTVQSLGNLYLPSQTSSTGQVPLSGIAKIQIVKSPLVISHLAQFPSVTVSFNLAEGCVVEHGGEADPRGRTGGVIAAIDHLVAAGRGSVGLALERGVPADRRTGGRVYRAGRVV